MSGPVSTTLLALVAAALLAGGAAATAGTPVTEDAVTAVASQLRCVVCQNFRADSPSEMAKQMRDVVRERLGQGETPEQVTAYFVEKYGEWVLLSPRARGFNLLVWVLPFAGLLAGLLIVLRVARRWSRPAAGSAGATETTALDPTERERVRLELGRFRD
jgi:cytochrome c-type biogenesis protein CcmH